MTSSADHAWRMFLGFIALIAAIAIGAAVWGLIIWLGWWLPLAVVGVFMLVCLIYAVGWFIETRID